MQQQTAAMVSALILGRPLCVPCMAAKTVTDEADAKGALASIAEHRLLRRRDHERCRNCGEVVLAYWLDPPLG